MADENAIKERICDIGKRIYDRNMVAANDGNISVKLNDHEFLCTPTGVSKGFMTPEYICKVDEKGEHTIVVSRATEMRIVHPVTEITLGQYNIPYGSELFKKDGRKNIIYHIQIHIRLLPAFYLSVYRKSF